MEILIVGAIIMFILIYNNTIDKDKFFADNQKYFEAAKEDDYQFLVYARYGEDVDLEQLFSKISKILWSIEFFTPSTFSIYGTTNNSKIFFNFILFSISLIPTTILFLAFNGATDIFL